MTNRDCRRQSGSMRWRRCRYRCAPDRPLSPGCRSCPAVPASTGRFHPSSGLRYVASDRLRPRARASFTACIQWAGDGADQDKAHPCRRKHTGQWRSRRVETAVLARSVNVPAVEFRLLPVQLLLLEHWSTAAIQFLHAPSTSPGFECLLPWMLIAGAIARGRILWPRQTASPVRLRLPSRKCDHGAFSAGLSEPLDCDESPTARVARRQTSAARTSVRRVARHVGFPTWVISSIFFSTVAVESAMTSASGYSGDRNTPTILQQHRLNVPLTEWNGTVLVNGFQARFGFPHTVQADDPDPQHQDSHKAQDEGQTCFDSDISNHLYFSYCLRLHSMTPSGCHSFNQSHFVA